MALVIADTSCLIALERIGRLDLIPALIADVGVTSHPHMLTNVENGLRFVGGGYRRDQLLYPSRLALERAGFADCMILPLR